MKRRRLGVHLLLAAVSCALGLLLVEFLTRSFVRVGSFRYVSHNGLHWNEDDPVRRYGLEVLDPDPGAGLYYPLDGHLTARGNDLVAREVVRAVRALKPVLRARYGRLRERSPRAEADPR